MMSIGEIIYRIQEQPMLKAVRKSDIVNHIKTVIELVGVPGLKQEKLVKLTVIDYRAELPSDFLERRSVRVIDGNDKIVMTHTTDQFGVFNKEIHGNTQPDYIFTHRIVGNFIYTDLKDCEIEVLYTSYYTDDNGWPMIPRNESLFLAIENYILSRYYRIAADQNAQFERAYARAEQQYCWYIKQASNFFNIPDPVEAQALGEMLIRLVPMNDNYYSDNKYAGQPERLNKRIW